MKTCEVLVESETAKQGVIPAQKFAIRASRIDIAAQRAAGRVAGGRETGRVVWLSLRIREVM